MNKEQTKAMNLTIDGSPVRSNILDANDLLRTCRENHRNSERKAAWRYRSLTHMRHWPDGDIEEWERVSRLHDAGEKIPYECFELPGWRVVIKPLTWCTAMVMVFYAAFYVAAAHADNRIGPVEQAAPIYPCGEP